MPKDSTAIRREGLAAALLVAKGMEVPIGIDRLKVLGLCPGNDLESAIRYIVANKLDQAGSNYHRAILEFDNRLLRIKTGPIDIDSALEGHPDVTEVLEYLVEHCF